jgi:NDP-sugar pyrophosphorylase family protein
MTNVVIPMAGRGQRFVDAGYDVPKPFITVHGVTLIERVLMNVQLPAAHYFLLARPEHLADQRAAVARIEARYAATFVPIPKVTEGAACTVLHAHRLINNDSPLLLANSDQYVDSSIGHYVDDCLSRELDGSLLTFVDSTRDPKWSFAKVSDAGLVTEVKEKVPISDIATVGIYFFRRGRDFVEGAIDMIAANDRVNGEFYTCPVYNYCIRQGRRIGIWSIDAASMHGLGTPDDLQRFAERDICAR